MDMNNKDNGTPNRFNHLLELLGKEVSKKEDTYLEHDEVAFSSKESRDAYLKLAQVPEKQWEGFPMTIAVATGKSITVTAENPLIINPGNTNPVHYHFDNLTLEKGGQIQCNTSVVMTVETFVKN